MNFKKFVAIAGALGCALTLASGNSLAGSGCMMSYSQEHFAKVNSAADNTHPVPAVQENAIDPKWLALLKEHQSPGSNQSAALVIHN